MIFTKEFLQSTVGGDSDETKIIYDKIIDTSRWSINHEVVFKVLSSGKFYESYYDVGATESQDEYAYEYANNTIECIEVEPVEETVIVYKAVK